MNWSLSIIRIIGLRIVCCIFHKRDKLRCNSGWYCDRCGRGEIYYMMGMPLALESNALQVYRFRQWIPNDKAIPVLVVWGESNER